MRQLQETPISALIALSWVTLAFLTDPVAPTSAMLLDHGALRPVEVADGSAWRLLTHAFLHGGALHIALNLMGLMLLGPRLELSLGIPRFVALYLVAGAGGGLACCLLGWPVMLLVGGSGALFGMLGAMVALGMRAGRHPLQFFEEGPGKSVLGLIAVNLVAGWLFPIISNTAHIGGLLSGFALTWWFLTPPRVRPGVSDIVLRVGLALLLASTVLYAIRPVARWDWLLLRWEHSEGAAERAKYRRAYSAARDLHPDAVDDAGMAADAQTLARWRAGN